MYIYTMYIVVLWTHLKRTLLSNQGHQFFLNNFLIWWFFRFKYVNLKKFLSKVAMRSSFHLFNWNFLDHYTCECSFTYSVFTLEGKWNGKVSTFFLVPPMNSLYISDRRYLLYLSLFINWNICSCKNKQSQDYFFTWNIPTKLLERETTSKPWAYGTVVSCVKFQKTLWMTCCSYLHRNIHCTR